MALSVTDISGLAGEGYTVANTSVLCHLPVDILCPKKKKSGFFARAFDGFSQAVINNSFT